MSSNTQVRIVGRVAGNDTLYDRAGATRAGAVSVEYVTCGAEGAAKAARFNSLDDEDRGGVTLHLTVDDQEGGFCPHAENIPGGVALYLAGEAEAEAMLIALAELLRQTRSARSQAIKAIEIKI